MKIKDILGFSNFYGSVKDEKMSFKLAYKLSKLASRVNEEIKFYQEKFRDIITEYAEKNEKGEVSMTEDGRGVRIIPGKEQELNAKMVELEDLDVDIEPNLTMEELDGLTLSVEAMNAVMAFIVDAE